MEICEYDCVIMRAAAESVVIVKANMVRCKSLEYILQSGTTSDSRMGLDDLQKVEPFRLKAQTSILRQTYEL